MLGWLIGSYSNQTFYPTSYNTVLLVGYNKTRHSRAIFWEMFESLPDKLVTTDACYFR